MSLSNFVIDCTRCGGDGCELCSAAIATLNNMIERAKAENVEVTGALYGIDPIATTPAKAPGLNNPVRSGAAERQLELRRAIAAERLPEMADELRRRGVFTSVEVINVGAALLHTHAEIHLSGKRGGRAAETVHVEVHPTVTQAAPYTVRIGLSTKEAYKAVVSGRETTFEGVLNVIDTFLAGFEVGKHYRP